MMGKVRQACRKNSRIVDFLDLGGAVVHGAADIQHDEDASVRLALIKLDVQTVRAPIHVPVDAPDFIPWHVLPVRREVHAETRIWRAVQSLNETFDHCARDYLQVLNLEQNLRIDEAVGGRPIYYWCTHTSFATPLILQSRFWNRHDFEQPLDNVFGLDAFRLGMEIGQD